MLCEIKAGEKTSRFDKISVDSTDVEVSFSRPWWNDGVVQAGEAAEWEHLA